MRLKSALRRGVAAAVIAGIVVSSGIPAYAKTWDIADGDITVKGASDESGNYNNVKQGEKDFEKDEGETVITGESDKNTVTIDTSEGNVDVTFDDLKIDVSGKTEVDDSGDSPVDAGKAAVTVQGDHDAAIELDGANELKSGSCNAGLEKNGNESSGKLTIKDDNGKDGSLTAEGGEDGAGIGGGGFGAGGGAGGGISNITIKDADVTAGADAGGAGIGSGSASGWISYPSIFPNWKAEHPNEGVASDITISGGRVKASGGDDSAGIGGGYLGSGSDITIKDNADVTANGGKWGAGIGGGRGGDGSDISISDSNVSASGGAAGAGIGGGRGGKGENVTISGSSTVSVKHGPGATLTSGTCYGAGAGIGNGGGKDDVRGEEIAPDISGIDSTGQGYINYYDSDNNLLTRVPSAPAPEENDSEGDDAEPALSASMKQAVSQLEVRGALRQNLMQDTSIVQQDYDADAHVLTIRAELSIATLTGTLGSLKALQAQGVTTIALVTQHCTSTLDLAELTALGGEDTVFSLVHTASIPALSVGGALHNELIH